MSLIKTIIVEDDLQIAEIQSRFIAKVEGFELVGIANSIAEASDLVEVFSPDLILLDIQLADGNGLEFMWQIRKQTRNVDFILITAAKEADSLQQAIRGGAQDYILKPMNFTRFNSALENYRKFKDKLMDVTALEQNVVDELLHHGNDVKVDIANKAVPKNIDELTVDKVQSAIKQYEGESLSAEELGIRIGMSRTTARRYLEYLASIDWVKPNLVYGSVGRPERLYFKNY